MAENDLQEIETGDTSFDVSSIEQIAECLKPHPTGMGMLRLRDYQIEAVDCIYESWCEHQATIAVLATGLGKTIIAADVIMRWPGEGRILFIAHVRELIDQAQNKIQLHTDELPSIEMGERCDSRDGDHPILDRSKVLVASIQTMVRRTKKFNPKDFDLVIVDEFHHAAASTYRALWQWLSDGNPNIKLLGITATPNRADKLSLGCIATNCSFQMGIRDGIDSGWLVPIKQQYITVDGLDFSKCRTVAQDLNEKDLEEAMLGAVEQDGMTPEQIQQVIEKQEAMLHRVAAPVVKEANGRSGIVYCVTVNHAIRQAEVLRRYPGVTAEVIHGKTPKEDRIDLVRKFKSGQLQFLVNVGVATEGFDVPGAQLIVMSRPTKSTGLYTQMIGRVTRPCDGLVDKYESPELRQEAIANSLKPFGLVLDFCGNSGKHKLVSTADVLAGDMPAEFVAAAIREMKRTGEAADIRQKTWQKKREHDEEVRRRQEQEERIREERKKEIQAREEARRARIRAEAAYRTQTIDPFDRTQVAPERMQGIFRGGASDKQIEYLHRLGVPRETSMKWTIKQAGGVINDLANRTGGSFIMRFGKHMGKALKALPVDYLAWAAKNLQDNDLQKNLEIFRREWAEEHLKQ